MVELQKITKIFGRGETSVHAVNNVSLNIQPGEIVVIMGPSGSGKTTLVSIAGGLMKPTDGTIIIDGTDITAKNERQLPKIRLTTMGFIFQSFNLLQNLTAMENAAIPLLLAGQSKQTAFDKSRALLERLNLSHRSHARPRELSGGEQQRVAIARALVNNPKVIFADEPTANLDRAIGHQVMQLLCSVGCEQGKSVIIVSHDERIKDVAHRVIYIEDGKLIREEPGQHNRICTMRAHSYQLRDQRA
ncbi:MAG: ABC transporter ATP-binding protein [Candidatus Kerfeldbacteria bacterium]|nr:ABC transporter ATP-binding protein [Candidatus Kerfeldbacteria bacterium]